jgi:hypothetical protein
LAIVGIVSSPRAQWLETNVEKLKPVIVYPPTMRLCGTGWTCLAHPKHWARAALAKHYGVAVRPCPPRRDNRKGVVEKANHVAAQRFWRTLPDDITVDGAPARAAALRSWCGMAGRLHGQGGHIGGAVSPFRWRGTAVPWRAFSCSSVAGATLPAAMLRAALRSRIVP